MSNHYQEDAFFVKWAHSVLRFRIPLLLLTIILTVLSVYQVRTQLKFQTSLESFSSERGEVLKSLDAFRETFGRDDVFLVMAAGDVFSMSYLEKLRKLHTELMSIDVIDEGSMSAGDNSASTTHKPHHTSKTAQLDHQNNDHQNNLLMLDDFDFGDEGEETADDEDEWEKEGENTTIDEVTSLINMRKVRYKDDALEVGDLLSPFPTEETLATVRENALKEPAVVGQVLGAKAQHSLLLVRTVPMGEERSDKVFQTLQKILNKHQDDDFRLGLAGPPALTAWLKSAMQRTMKSLFAGALLVMLIVLITLFRHPIGVIGPILVIVMSVIWTLGMMATLGMPMTLLSTIMPAFLMAVGLGDSIHLVSVYRDLRWKGLANQDAIVEAVSSTGLPLFFTTLTTAVGLLSFRFADVLPLSEMGTAAAYGVGAALLHSLVFLPILLSFNQKSLLGAAKLKGGDQLKGGNQLKEGDRLDRTLWRLTGLTSLRAGKLTPARTWRTLGLATLILLVALLGMSMLRVSHNPLAWLPSDNPLRQVFDEVDREVGGTASVQLLIETKSERGIKDLGFLRGLEALDQHIANYRDPRLGEMITTSMSVLDIVRETNQQLHEGNQAYYRLPDTQRAASDLLFMFENSKPKDLRRLATVDLKTTQLTVRVKWMDANAYPALAEYVRRGVKTHLSKHAQVRLTGSIYTLASTVSSLILNLLRSFSVAFIVITLFMILLLRDLKLGLIAMVPNLFPVIIIMGFMGLNDIPIDMANLMLASIAIGIAVDDTIHFLHHFRVAREMGATVNEAVELSVQHAGRAMVATSLVLTLGFSVFLTADLLHLQRFGGLIAMTALIALVIDMAFTPPLLRVTFGQKDEEASEIDQDFTSG